uniref:Kin17_mid domain-containing protein n=1 Tax=Heterorhabditis bacteriophora TaxID=37862 RepID=A0A1I7X662_HETBA
MNETEMMGKHERGTPKDIANRIKSKGLQKLRWFCQMCHKQCRDQNGFKCHLTSESHQRQLLLFAEDSNTYLRDFSKQFETNFMHGHVHMNSTLWHTLTGFVQYLGSSGKCKIDQNEKGWYIQYIDQEEVLRKAEEAKRAKAEKDDEDRQLELINERVQSELIRSDDGEKITLNFNMNKKPTSEELNKPTSSHGLSVFNNLKDEKPIRKEGVIKDEEEPSEQKMSSTRERERRRKYEENRDYKIERRSRSRSRNETYDYNKNDSEDRPLTQKREEKIKKSALDEIREMEELKREKKNRKDHWMHKGIIVKVITKRLGPDFFKSKGVVESLIDDYTANVRLDDGTLVKLNQSHVETVIPSMGRNMLVVNGAYRGSLAVSNILLK